MSKAEEEANKRYGITRGDDTQETSGIDMQRASDFIEGYHQAEKDLEPTWEDIKIIDTLIAMVNVEGDYVGKDAYQEILKRFKERKENAKVNV